MLKICKNCKKEFEAERDRREYCSLKCSAQNSTRIAGKESHKNPDTKEANHNWKGGRSKNNYYYKKRYKEKYPEKVKANDKVQRALKSGKLTKPNFCSNCGKQEEREKIEGHHEDYDKPLQVEWLCKDCHRERHS